MLRDESAEIIFTVDDSLVENFLDCRQCEKSIEITECAGLDHPGFIAGIFISLSADYHQCNHNLHALLNIPV